MYCFANLWHSSTFSAWRSISSRRAWGVRVVRDHGAHPRPPLLPALPGPTFLPQLLTHGLAIGQRHVWICSCRLASCSQAPAGLRSSGSNAAGGPAARARLPHVGLGGARPASAPAVVTRHHASAPPPRPRHVSLLQPPPTSCAPAAHPAGHQTYAAVPLLKSPASVGPEQAAQPEP